MRSLIGKLVTLHDGAKAIVVELTDRPGAAWIDGHDDTRVRAIAVDAAWYKAVLLTGGARTVAEPLACVVRDSTASDLAIAFAAGNEFARQALQRLPGASALMLENAQAKHTSAVEPKGAVALDVGIGSENSCQIALSPSVFDRIMVDVRRGNAIGTPVLIGELEVGIEPPNSLLGIDLQWGRGVLPVSTVLWIGERFADSSQFSSIAWLELLWPDSKLISPRSLVKAGEVSFWSEFLVIDLVRQVAVRLVGRNDIASSARDVTYYACAGQHGIVERKAPRDHPRDATPIAQGSYSRKRREWRIPWFGSAAATCVASACWRSVTQSGSLDCGAELFASPDSEVRFVVKMRDIES